MLGTGSWEVIANGRDNSSEWEEDDDDADGNVYMMLSAYPVAKYFSGRYLGHLPHGFVSSAGAEMHSQRYQYRATNTSFTDTSDCLH